MWPFSRNKQSKPTPQVQCGGIEISWDPVWHGWEFSDDHFDYSLRDNPVFNPAILTKLQDVKEWLSNLDPDIDRIIEQHLENWCAWNGEKNVVCIDVSRLLEKREIEVSYAGNDDWGDLGIDILITDGKITDSSAGD